MDDKEGIGNIAFEVEYCPYLRRHLCNINIAFPLTHAIITIFLFFNYFAPYYSPHTYTSYYINYLIMQASNHPPQIRNTIQSHISLSLLHILHYRFRLLAPPFHTGTLLSRNTIAAVGHWTSFFMLPGVRTPDLDATEGPLATVPANSSPQPVV